MTKRVIMLAVVVATLATSMLMTSCGSKPDYNPMQYVTLDVKYFNGEGVAEPVVTPPATTDEQSSKVIELLKVTKFNYSPDRELSNGDVVTVVPVYDEEKAKKQGFAPVTEATKFTVEGLPEGVEVDLWEYEDFSFIGTNGEGKIKSQTLQLTDDKLLNFRAHGVNFKSDKPSNLSNDDTVTVTVTYDKAQALELGYKITSEPTKQFTVSGLK